MNNRFAPKAALALIEEETATTYSHGFTDIEAAELKAAHNKLGKRNLSEDPVTLQEFRDIVVPYLRIVRTTAFNLNPEKIKPVKIPKIPKVKEPKVKKLTKKFIKEELSRLVFAQAIGETITEEDILFIATHTTTI